MNYTCQFTPFNQIHPCGKKAVAFVCWDNNGYENRKYMAVCKKHKKEAEVPE